MQSLSTLLPRRGRGSHGRASSLRPRVLGSLFGDGTRGLSFPLPPSAAAAAAAAAPSPSVVSGNWSVALSVKNRMRWHRLGWDHPQVMLFYGHEFVAGTFLERFSVAPRGEGTLETGTAAFSRDVGEWAARAMGTDGGDGGVMELAVRLLRHDDRSPDWLGWDSFDCRGLKVGFSSQNESQVGLLEWLATQVHLGFPWPLA